MSTFTKVLFFSVFVLLATNAFAAPPSSRTRVSFKEAQDSDASAVDLQDGQIFTFEIPSAIAARALGGPPQNGAAGGCERCSKRNFRWVNRYRKSKNLGRIRWRANLAALAMKHSKKMYDTKVFAHSNYPYAENIAFASNYYTWATVHEGFFTQWKKSPGHNANMLRASHRCGGVGIYGAGRTFYGTQVFTSNC